MDKETSFAVVWMPADSQLRMRDTEGVCDYFLPPRRNSLDMSHEALKSCDKMLRCSSLLTADDHEGTLWGAI